MTPADAQQEWLANRLDTLESKMEGRMERLSDELKETRHQLRPMIETAVTAVAQQEIITRGIEKDIAGIEEWRREDGTLDQRLRRRHDEIRSMVKEAVGEIRELIAAGERSRAIVETARLTEWSTWRAEVNLQVEAAKQDRWYRAGGWRAMCLVGVVAAALGGIAGAIVAAVVQ